MSNTIYKESTLVASITATASSDSGELTEQFVDADSMRVQLEVTAASGTTPTLDVTIEDSLDGTNWNTIGTFAQKTGTGTEVINITTPFARRLRVKHVVGGTTPSFTFNVKAVSRAAVA